MACAARGAKGLPGFRLSRSGSGPSRVAIRLRRRRLLAMATPERVENVRAGQGGPRIVSAARRWGEELSG